MIISFIGIGFIGGFGWLNYFLQKREVRFFKERHLYWYEEAKFWRNCAKEWEKTYYLLEKNRIGS